MFTPKLFISVGATGAMFTLRETYLHTTYVRGEGVWGGAVINGVYQGSSHTQVRSFHHYNLGQNPDEAFTKAQEASERMGIELSTTREQLAEELREIKRATAEEMAARHQAQLELEAKWEAERTERRLMQLDQIDLDGVFANGPYRGTKIEECADMSYLMWIVSNKSKFEQGSLMQHTALKIEQLIEEGKIELLPEADPDRHFGTEGQRFEADVTVVFVTSFTRQGFGSYHSSVAYLVSMVTSTGETLVSISDRFRAKVGDKLRIKGTVKSHDRYKGKAQTKVQRIKVVG